MSNLDPEVERVASDAFQGCNVSLGSCASLASLVLPAGTTTGGLPIGLEFDALPDDDRRLLAVGLSLERALGSIAAPDLRL